MLGLVYPVRELKDEEQPVILEDPYVHGKGGPGLFFSSAEPENAYQNRVEAGRIGKKNKIRQKFSYYKLTIQEYSAVKRIPVTEPVWKDLVEMRSAGHTCTDLLAEMIEDRKKRRLEEGVRK